MNAVRTAVRPDSLGRAAVLSILLHAGLLGLATFLRPDPPPSPAPRVVELAFLPAPEPAAITQVAGPAAPESALPEPMTVEVPPPFVAREPVPASPEAAAEPMPPPSVRRARAAPAEARPPTTRPVAHGESAPSPTVATEAMASPPRQAPAAQAAAVETAAGPAPDAAERFGAQLLEWLERHRDYPRAARLRRLTGEVVVRFRLAEGGRLRDVAILRSSGHDLLDRAVLDMLARAQPLPPWPEARDFADVEFRVPIRFVLAGM